MARAKRKKAKRERLHREPIVRETARLLDSGKPTKWRWFGEALHGLRAGMCLKGMAWAAADKRANEIVTLARHRIGLQYPSWWEAQREPEEREYWFCEACGGRLEPEQAGKPWCSEECQATVKARREVRRKHGDNYAHRRAVRILLTNGAVPSQPAERMRRCHHCSEPFTTLKTRARFCSRACARKGRRYYTECLVCGATFWRHAEALTCSPACRLEARRRSRRISRKEKPCAHCGAMFKPRDFGRALYCSKRCNSAANFRKRQLLEEAHGGIQQVG